MLNSKQLKRMESERNLWLATIRPNNTPHLVPIWFVWLDNKAYLCTPHSSVKARNIEKNARVVFALEDGDDPIVIEAEAKIEPTISVEIVSAFQEKFDWDIRTDAVHDTVIELTPTRLVL